MATRGSHGRRPLCRLRVKDVDFGRNQITVRRGMGDEDRATMLPVSIKSELAAHLERVRAQHERDLATGAGWVELPGALAKKLPSAGREWPWQWVFPATRHYVERETGQKRRTTCTKPSSSTPCAAHPEARDLPHVPPFLCFLASPYVLAQELFEGALFVPAVVVGATAIAFIVALAAACVYRGMRWWYIVLLLPTSGAVTELGRALLGR